MGNSVIKVYENSDQLAAEISNDLVNFIEKEMSTSENVTVALSGGNTPKKIYKYLADNFAELDIWKKVKFFWGDERCVQPDDPESNFGAAKELFFDHLKIKELQIFRIKGEDTPSVEAERYGKVISEEVEMKNGWPRFDLMILGIGEDGHTASIFPDQIGLYESDKICAEARHPVTGQQRVTVTGKVINNSSNIIILASGKGKNRILKEIVTDKNPAYPASKIQSEEGTVFWYCDENAAEILLAEKRSK